MTKKERASPKIIDGKRRRRISKGSGTQVPEVNKLLKMQRQMADMMKQMGKNKGMMAKMLGGLSGGMLGGGASQTTPEMLEQAKVAAASGQLPGMPKGLPGLGSNAMPKGLPGLGVGLPGLGGGLPKLSGGRTPKKKKKR